MSAEEFARLKHDIETRQVAVDKAFAMFDDFQRKHNGGAETDFSIGSVSKEAKQRLDLLEHLMEAMSRLNASYKTYVQMLEERIGF